MSKATEAPKANKTVRRLRRKAAESEDFCQLVCDMRELLLESFAPLRELKDATILALFEHAWSMYRVQQGMAVIEEEIEEELGDADDCEEV